MTAHPDARWVLQQARNFVLLADQEADGIESVKVGPAAPNLYAHAERWVLSIKSECLDHFMVFGEEHLRLLVSSFMEHHNEDRPHQGVGTVSLKVVADKPASEGAIVCYERLGGLLTHYERKAA